MKSKKAALISMIVFIILTILSIAISTVYLFEPLISLEAQQQEAGEAFVDVLFIIIGFGVCLPSLILSSVGLIVSIVVFVKRSKKEKKDKLSN